MKYVFFISNLVSEYFWRVIKVHFIYSNENNIWFYKKKKKKKRKKKKKSVHKQINPINLSLLKVFP